MILRKNIMARYYNKFNNRIEINTSNFAAIKIIILNISLYLFDFIQESSTIQIAIGQIPKNISYNILS